MRYSARFGGSYGALNTIKMMIALAAMVMLGLVAMPAMASADPAHWTIDGVEVTSQVDVNTSGTLTLANPATGVTVTCDVTDEGWIGPDGTDAITDFTFGTPCDTNVSPSCKVVSATALDLPWLTQLVYDPSSGEFRDTITGVHFTNQFSADPSCGALASLPLDVSGDITGVVDQSFNPTRVLFDNTSGLSDPTIGPVTISGFDEMTPVGGGHIDAEAD